MVPDEGILYRGIELDMHIVDDFCSGWRELSEETVSMKVI